MNFPPNYGSPLGKMGFEKIIKMIDDLVVELKAAHNMDNDKKARLSARPSAQEGRAPQPRYLPLPPRQEKKIVGCSENPEVQFSGIMAVGILQCNSLGSLPSILTRGHSS